MKLPTLLPPLAAGLSSWGDMSSSKGDMGHHWWYQDLPCMQLPPA